MIVRLQYVGDGGRLGIGRCGAESSRRVDDDGCDYLGAQGARLRFGDASRKIRLVW